ncbi:MAG: FGGY-family carbohydrate kinase [Anaerolineae bacterium]|nr:FGGY-family carbohydrate kinase [Anaerolineae bacterium]
MAVVIGIDVGTSGAKALAVDQNGKVIARVERKFSKQPYTPGPGLAEQDANEWWDTVRPCLQALSQQLGQTEVAALAIDSTSGTFVPVDRQGNPLIPALMYNDNRATGLDAEVNAAAGDFTERFGYTFPSSFALVKLVWLLRHRPAIVQATYKFLHAADFLVGKLTGNFDCTDTSNALKSGVDLLTGDWPAFIQDRLGLPLDKFARVSKPGDKVGEVSAEAAAQTGIKAGTPVVAGGSDGTVSFLASGAKAIGDWTLNIGTTITIRGLARDLICDPQGRLYCHRHPEGYWLPGGASNVGGEGLVKTFGSQIGELDQPASAYLPSSLIVYPLVRKGERMPFMANDAEGFMVGTPRDDAEKFASYAQGIALVTAWSVQEAGALGAPTDGEYYLSGGGAHGKTLSRVLASVLSKPLIVAQEPDATMGSALLAAGWAWYGGSVSAAQAAMVERADVIEPIPAWFAPLQARLEELKHQCRRRGYLKNL